MSKARDIADSTKTLDVDGGTIKLDGNYPVGTNNVALGDTALDSNVSGNNNTALGHGSLTAQTGSASTAVGASVLAVNTGNENTAVGAFSMGANTTGTANVCVGLSALASNSTASQNVALGYQASSASNSGQNVSIGYQSMLDTTSGGLNTAMGYRSMYENTTGASNVALGHSALLNSTTASNNVAIGYQAGDLVTTGNGNAVIGSQAGTSANYGNCTFFVNVSGFSNSANQNTYIGQQAGYSMSSGSSNTILGRYNGNQGGLDIRTSSNNIVLSDGDGNPRVYVASGGSMGVGTTGFDTSNTTGVTLQKYANGAYITIGKTSSSGNGEGYINFIRNGSYIGSVSQASTSSVSYNTTSDYRLKENVVNLEGATARLVQLQPKRFDWINDTDGAVWDGFLAHEVQSVVPEAITGAKDAVDADGNPEYQGIDQSKLVPLLVATIQELEARITALEGA